MPAISDTLLTSGTASHIEAVHGERVQILDGPDAGKWFIAVREVESDQVITDLGVDARSKIVLRFTKTPAITKQGTVKTDDNKIWKAVRRQEANFLTQDFELTQIVSGKDK